MESEAAIAALKHILGAAFKSCRYKLGSVHEYRAQYERLIEVLHAHHTGFFFYNGDSLSRDTTRKVSQISAEVGEPIASGDIWILSPPVVLLVHIMMPPPRAPVHR